MVENYKHLYEQTKKMLTMYQDELIPGYRKQIEDLEAKSKWIPVAERLPEKEELVLCIGKKGGMFLANHLFCFSNGSCYCNVPNARGGRYAIYWMPLPEPPKEVE